MKFLKSNHEVLKALEGKDYTVDSLGRIVIEDLVVMDMIKGAFGGASAEMPDPYWNGACSNSRC